MKCYVRIVSFCRSELNKFLVESYVNFAYILRYGCSWPIGSYLGIKGPAIPMGGEARLIFVLAGSSKCSNWVRKAHQHWALKDLQNRGRYL